MKDNFKDLIRRNRDAKRDWDESTKQSCKERLKTIAKKKMTTIMIGSLDAVEKKLGFLFGLDKDGKPTNNSLSEEEQHIKNLYKEIRSSILDLGNDQIYNLHEEIDMHEIEWNRYHIKLPIRPEGPKNVEEQSNSQE